MLTSWNPFDDGMRTESSLSSMLSHSVDARVAPAVDIDEREDAYLILAELPGVVLQDVQVELDGDVLTLSAEKREGAREKVENLLTERQYGSFRRAFQVPTQIERGAITAEMKDGVLTVTLPKSAVARPKRIPIQARSSKTSQQAPAQIEAAGESVS